jgi:hypothetical protein
MEETYNKLPPDLQVFYLRSLEMAERITHGKMPMNEGVDFLYSAAQWAGLTEKYGDDEIQGILAKALIDASMGTEAA